jgi:hypothetical protein
MTVADEIGEILQKYVAFEGSTVTFPCIYFNGTAYKVSVEHNQRGWIVKFRRCGDLDYNIEHQRYCKCATIEKVVEQIVAFAIECDVPRIPDVANADDCKTLQLLLNIF